MRIFKSAFENYKKARLKRESENKLLKCLKDFRYKLSFVDEGEKNLTIVNVHNELQLEHVIIQIEPNILHDIFIVNIQDPKQTELVEKYFQCFDKDIDFSSIIMNLKNNHLDFVCDGSLEKELYIEQLSENRYKLGLIDKNYEYFSKDRRLNLKDCFNDMISSVKLIPEFFNINMQNFKTKDAMIHTQMIGEKALNMSCFDDYIYCKKELANKFVLESKHNLYDIYLKAYFKDMLESMNFEYSIAKNNRGLINIIFEILNQPPIISLMFSKEVKIKSQIWEELYDDYYNKRENKYNLHNVLVPCYTMGLPQLRRYEVGFSIYDDDSNIYFKLTLTEPKTKTLYSIKNEVCVEVI